MIRLADTLGPMADFPVALAEHIQFEDGDTLQKKFNEEELGGGDNSLTITQEEYDNLSIAEQLDGLYYTYDTKRIYKNGIQYGANEPIELTVDEFKALKEAGALDEKQEYIITTNENGTLLEASDIGYNGATSGLSSLSVQGAIDEVNDKIDNIIDDENVDENTVLSSKKTMEEIAFRTANRQVKTFDNTGSSTEKWYKICSAITGGIGCNIKLTASRADSTATVQYFSALFRDSRYRYTSYYISREKTVYESELVAEYSSYIIADANNDIWVHVPSCGKAIIEIDTRVITIDGTAGTPVEDYVYSSFEHQYDGKINDSTTNTTSTWSGSKIASEINPTIDISKVFSDGTLNIATLCSTYGNGRYVIVGQGTAGNGSATIDIWTLVGNAISYTVNVTYSNRTSNIFVGYTYDNPTINFETGYLNSCNHIAKVCTLA